MDASDFVHSTIRGNVFGGRAIALVREERIVEREPETTVTVKAAPKKLAPKKKSK